MISEKTTYKEFILSDEIHLRPTTIEDGLAVYNLVSSCPEIPSKPAISYYSLCSDFSHTSIVAEIGGRIIGFVGGYRPPEREDTLVVTVVTVEESVRKMGLASEMLSDLLSRLSTVGVINLEVIAPKADKAIIAVIEGYAEKNSRECESSDYLSSKELAGDPATIKLFIKLK